MEERKIKKKVVDHAKSKNWVVFQLKANGKQGIPDTMFIKNGIVLFIEFKSSIGKLRPMQKVIIRKFIKNKIKIFVVNDFKIGILIIDKYDK